MEVYIDNIVVKSETLAEHAQHMEEAFCLIRAYNISSIQLSVLLVSVRDSF